MSPLDVDTLCDSVKRTGRCVIAHEATRFSGFGAELAATIQEDCFWNLEAPIQRVAGWDTPYPHAFEWQYFPGQDRVIAGLNKVPGAIAVATFGFKLPDLGEGTVEAEIVAWHVKPGDLVVEDQVIADVMTEKATVELPAPVAGRVVSLVGEPGEAVPVGTEIIVFETADSSTEVAETPAKPSTLAPVESTAQKEAAREPADHTLTSPSIRRLARDSGIDLTGIRGSGPMGRIVREDLEPYLQEQSGAAETTPADQLAQVAPAAPPPAGVEEIEIVGVRRFIAKRMSEANRQVPHFSYVEEVDVTDLESVRQHLNNKYAEQRGRVTYLPFIMLGLTRALQKFPQCNAHFDKERNLLLQHHAIHIGLATQTDEGLKVPVIRNVEQKSLWDLASQARSAAEAARSGTATPDQLAGSTITVTSLGKLGGIASTPVINVPEVAIVAINRAIERPAIRNGKITARLLMNISASFDHRFIDGHDGAAMIQALKEQLERPTALFAEANNAAAAQNS